MTGELYLAGLLELILQHLANEKGLNAYFETTSRKTRRLYIFNPHHEPVDFINWIIPGGRKIRVDLSIDGLKLPDLKPAGAQA